MKKKLRSKQDVNIISTGLKRLRQSDELMMKGKYKEAISFRNYGADLLEQYTDDAVNEVKKLGL